MRTWISKNCKNMVIWCDLVWHERVAWELRHLLCIPDIPLPISCTKWVCWGPETRDSILQRKLPLQNANLDIQKWPKYGDLMWFGVIWKSCVWVAPSTLHSNHSLPYFLYKMGMWRPRNQRQHFAEEASATKCKPGCPKMSKIWWFDVIWCDMKEWCACCAIYSAVRKKNWSVMRECCAIYFLSGIFKVATKGQKLRPYFWQSTRRRGVQI